jgi:hypothetical protein
MTRLAERVGREPFFLGYHLAALRSEYAQSFDEQALAFGLDAEALAKLALCKVPTTAAQVEQIALTFFLDTCPKQGQYVRPSCRRTCPATGPAEGLRWLRPCVALWLSP